LQAYGQCQPNSNHPPGGSRGPWVGAVAVILSSDKQRWPCPYRIVLSHVRVRVRGGLYYVRDTFII